MKTNVRDTSLEAYRGVNISRAQAKVMEFLLRHPGRDFTRAEIATFSGIEINRICPRVVELRDAGLIEELVIRRACKLSGKQAHPIRLAPKQKTLALEAA